MALQKLICVRHGRPTVRYSRRPLVASGELNDTLDAYDRAGLDRTAHPPSPTLLHAFAISSDLKRAVETAILLTGRERAQIHVSPTFREVPLPRFQRRNMKLPVPLHFLILRAGWLTGAMPASEAVAEVAARVRRAADELERHFEQHEEIALFSHGFFLWLLGRELRRRGFTRASPLPYGYLEQRVLVRAATGPRPAPEVHP